MSFDGTCMCRLLDYHCENLITMTEVENPLQKDTTAGYMDASQDTKKKSLTHELDGLLERYLHTLDEYEKLTKQLSKQLSSVSSKSVGRKVCSLM